MRPSLLRHSPSHSESGEAEHSYLASSADLMIGLLFIFIIMVAFLALQRRNAQAEAEMTVAIAAAAAAAIATDDVLDPRGYVTRKIGDSIRDAIPNIEVNPSSGVISLPEEVLFDRGSARLKPGGLEKLKQVSAKLAEVLPCFVASERRRHICPQNLRANEIETLFVEGHTDSVPMPTPGGNWQLSFNRARATADALIVGTPLDAFRNEKAQPIFSYSAYADTRTKPGIDPSDGRNRRVDLRFVLAYRPPEAITKSLTGSSTGTSNAAAAFATAE